MDDIASVAEKEERGLFSTIKARDTAITCMADIMNKLSFNFLYNGSPLKASAGASSTLSGSVYTTSLLGL